MRTEWFTKTSVQGTVTLTRGEALRALIAAIADTAKAKLLFTTDDVFDRVRSDFASAKDLREMTADSKLIAVALAKARKQGLCQPTPGLAKTADPVANRRPKRVWASLTYVYNPDLVIT